MALPRKRPSAVLKRDTDFTQTIGKPATDKPNPYAMVGQELMAKLESARPREAAEPPPATSAAVEEPERAQDVSAPDLPEMKGPSEAPAPQTDTALGGPDAQLANAAEADERVESKVAPGTSDTTNEPFGSATQPTAERAGGAVAPTDVVITMRIPTDLVKRADKWARAVGLPVATLLRNSFNRFKPELSSELQKIKAGDVHLDRPESVSHHMQARLRFTEAEYADMQARLDPAGFGILASMLNHYARARFSSFLDELMADAGY